MSFLFGGHDTDADEPRVRLLAEQLQGADAVTDQLEVLTDALAMAKRRRLLFGKRGTDSLCSLLKRPELDPEVAQSLLETLLALVDPSQDGPSDAEHAASQREAAGLNAARFLGDPAATGALLDLAASEATWTRVLCVQLLAALNAAKPDMASAALLRTEQGLSRLLDRLADRKEEVRNEVLVLLGSLTRGSSNLQSYVAFEDGHSRLLGLAAREAGAVRRLARRFAAPGSGAPGAVVPPHRFDVALDAVKIVANVLGGNAITRKLFVQSAEPLRDALAVLDAAVQIGKASPRSLELASAGLAVLEALAGAPDGRSRDRAAGAASGVGGIVAAAPPAAPRVAVAGSRKSDASKAGSAESSSAGNGAAAASSRAEDEDEDEEAVDPSTAAANAAADSAVAAAIGTEPLLWDGLGRVAFSNRLPAPIAARAAAVLTAVVRAGGSRAQITAAMSAVRDVATGVDPHSFLLPQAATDSPGAAPVDPASAALADALELAPAGSAAASAVGRLLIPSLAVRTSLSASDPAWADAACSLAAAVAWPAALPASSPTPREGSARGTGRETAVDDAGPATAVSHILSPPPVPPSDAADDAAALPPITALQAAASALVTASRRLTNVAGDCDGPAAAALAAVAARASRLLAGAFSASAACGQLALRVGLRVEAGGGLAEALAAKGAARPGQLGMCRGSADAALLPLLVGTLASLSTSGHTAPALSVLVASVAELVAAWAGTCPSVAIEAARSGADAALAATFARRVVHHDLPSHARVAAAAAVAAVSGIARAVGSDASAQLRSALLDAVGVAGADQCLRLAATQPPRSSSSSPPEPDHPAVAWVLPRPEEEGVGDSSGVPAGASRAVRWCSAATSVRLYVPPAPGSDERAGPRAPGPATVVLLSSSAAARAAELRAWIRKGFLDAAMSDSADADGTAGDGGASAEEALPEPWATRWRIAKEILSLPASEAASAGAAQPAAGWRTQPGSGPPQAAQGQDGGAQALVMFGGRRITVAEAEAELERAGRRADQAGAALKDASSSLRDAQSAARAANAEAESLRAVSGGDAGTLAELKLAYDSIRGSFADAQRGRVAAEDEVKELQAALEAARADAEGLRASASAAAERAAAATAAAASAQEAGPSAEEAEAAVQAVRDELERVRAAHAQEVAVLRADLEASLDGGDMGPSADAGKIEELELQVADASRRAEASDAAAAAARKDAEEARAEAAEARAAAEEARERGAAEVEAAAQEAEAERASAAEARDQVAAARAEAESLRTGAHATDEDVAAARRAAAEAASRCDSLECQVRKLQEALEDERAETHKAADRERAKAAAVADEATREAESRVQAAERRAAEQLRAASERAAELEAALREAGEARRAAEQEAAVRGARSDNEATSRLREQLAELAEKLRTAEGRAAAAKEQLRQQQEAGSRELDRVSGSAQEAAAAAKASVERLRARIKDEAARRETAEVAAEEAEAEAAAASRRAAAAEATAAAAKRALAEAEAQVAASHAAEADLRAQLLETSSALAAAKAEATQAALERDSAEAQVERLQGDLATAAAEADAAAAAAAAATARSPSGDSGRELEVLRGEHEDLLVLCAALDVELSIAYEAVQSLGGAEAAAACRRLTAERLGEAAEDQGSSAEVLAELSMAGDASFDASALFGQQHQQQPQHVGGSGSGAAGLFASALDDGDDADDTQDGPRDHHRDGSPLRDMQGTALETASAAAAPPAPQPQPQRQPQPQQPTDPSLPGQPSAAPPVAAWPPPESHAEHVSSSGPPPASAFFSASPPESPDAGAVPSTASRVFAQSGGAAGHDTVWAEEHGADWQDHGTGGWAEYQDGSGGHSDWPEQPDSDPATSDALATADRILPAGRMGAETPAQGWEPAADAPPSHGMFSAGQPRGGALLAQGAPEQGSVAESQHVWSTGHDAADEAEQLQADGAQQAQADEHEQLQDEEEIPLDASDHGFSSAQNADEPSSMFGDAHQSASPPRAVGSEAGESSFSATLVSVLFGGDVAPSPDKRSHSQSRAAPPAAPPAPAADRQGQGSSAHDFATAVSAGLSTWGSHGGLARAAANGGAGGGRDLSEAGDGQGGDEFDEDDDDDVDGGTNSSFIDAVSGYAGVLASLVGKSEGPAATQGSQAREGASQSKPMFGGSLSSSTAPPVQVQAVVAGQPSADPARGPVGQTAAPPGSALPAASPPKMSAPPTATSMFAPAHGATRKAKRGRRALYPGAAHVAAEPQDPQPPRPATASGPPPAVFKPAVSRPPAPSPAPTIPEGALSLPVQRPTVTAELAPAAAATFHASPGEPEDAQEEEENAAAFFSPVQPASVFGTVGDGADSRSARLGLPAASTAKALFGQQGPRVERAKPADAVFATQSADAEGEGLDHDDDADGASAWF
ncbi:hypothetical protein FNF28_00815 [Cafeteria roenbergensis]|uniref:Vesicle tethering protein Uso1/P115-like head domain-containing protein n=1 Tax=Cafeteria roenbergensis TaxID=33653 RepID=A0A5A8E2X7_CAFRO|nr:hypothetical protein FNF28_00815 [Cafeteria roenbergensis]